MTRILLTIGRLERGGAEMRLLQLFVETKKRNEGIVPIIFVVSGAQGSLDDAYRLAGVRLIYGKPGILGLWHLYHVCRQERPDIVHANVLLASGFHLFVAWLAGIRTRISHIRNTGYDRDDFLFRIRNSIFRYLLNLFSTQVVGVCDGARLFAGTPEARWQTIYNGLDTKPATGSNSAANATNLTKQIVFLGRLHPQKNPVRAVNIMSIVKTLTGGRANLKVYGRRVEPLYSEVIARIREHGLEAEVKVCGETDTPLAVLQDADVLLLTSIREGLPGVVLEALSIGTPVVGSAIPGVIEIARYCQGVTVVDLAADNSVWAEALITASQSDREVISKTFQASPFTLENHYRSMMSLWLGDDHSMKPQPQTARPAGYLVAP